MSKIKVLPCPFCGLTPVVQSIAGFDTVEHRNDDCPCEATGWSLCEWNKRFGIVEIEDKQPSPDFGDIIQKIEAAHKATDNSTLHFEPVDRTKCPQCSGPADNGFDRCDPPNPYCCKECEDSETDATGENQRHQLSDPIHEMLLSRIDRLEKMMMEVGK